MRAKNKIDARPITSAMFLDDHLHLGLCGPKFAKRRSSPNIIDIADSCSPQELEYTAGWRDRMSGTERSCAGRHESAYKLGWRDADWNILIYGSAGIIVKGGQ